MTAKDLIFILQQHVDNFGDKEVHVYKSFSQSTVNINPSDVVYDHKEDDIYIGVYA